jgi:uncharacterized protein YehS (DUF1456 family)
MSRHQNASHLKSLKSCKAQESVKRSKITNFVQKKIDEHKEQKEIREKLKKEQQDYYHKIRTICMSHNADGTLYRKTINNKEKCS